jgi:hypothetical protein
MLNAINWHDMSESPPLYKTLLLITEDGALRVGTYIHYDGKLIRIIRPKTSDELLVRKDGDTVLWAELPSREEIEAFIYNRKESV